MQLKVINSDSVKVLIERKDIDSGYPEMEMITPDIDKSGTFIVSLLEYINEKTGVNFLDSKVIIDILPGINNCYYLIISRLSSEPRRSADTQMGEDIYLFELDSIEDVVDALSLTSGIPDFSVSSVKAYKYRGRYYLSLAFLPQEIESSGFAELMKKLKTCCRKCRWSLYSEPILSEWGELLIEKGASI